MDTFDAALLLLRLGVGLTFAAHGAQKAFGWWGGPGREGWRGAMGNMGFRPAGLFAVLSTGIELVGGLFLAVGLVTPLAAAALVAQSVVIIGQVHWQNGFFNGKGGYEFPLSLGLGSVVVLLLGAGAWSLDSALGFALDPSLRAALVVLGLVGGALALGVPRLGSNRTASHA